MENKIELKFDEKFIDFLNQYDCEWDGKYSIYKS
jgi:hypothetical protein